MEINKLFLTHSTAIPQPLPSQPSGMMIYSAQMMIHQFLHVILMDSMFITVFIQKMSLYLVQ